MGNRTVTSLPPQAPVSGSLREGSASRWAVWLATGCGAGYRPAMPGTYGSAEGVVIYLFLGWLAGNTAQGLWILGAAVLLLQLLSLWIIAKALPHFSSDDPSAIVLDEIAGQALTLLPLAFLDREPLSSWLALATGFVLFRALDTLKPYPIWKLGHLKGAWGVLADDAGAAVVAGSALCGLGWLGWV